MKSIIIKWLFAAFLVGVTIGCQPQVVEVYRDVAAVSGGEVAPEMAPPAAPLPQATMVLAQDQLPAQERLIIRTVDIDLVVQDTEQSLNEMGSMAQAMGGWVVESRISNSVNGARGSITMRVPAAEFEDALAQIRAEALEVTRESSTGQDVTEEYVDLSSRLGNLEATAERVRAFLDEAETVEEALAVNAELSRLEEQIEVIKGRMQFLSQSAAYSTIHVSLTPDELNQPLEVAGWRPQGVAKDAVEALVAALQGIGSFIIWLGIFILPVGAIVLLPLYFIGRWLRGRRRGSRSVQPPEPSSETDETD